MDGTDIECDIPWCGACNEDETTPMDNQSNLFSNPPFFKVFFKCDDTFNPTPSTEVSNLLRNLIQLNLPHMVIQNRYASISDATPNSIIWTGDNLLTEYNFRESALNINQAICIECYEDSNSDDEFFDARYEFYQNLIEPATTRLNRRPEIKRYNLRARDILQK